MEKRISEIKKEFEEAGTEKLLELFAVYADDPRARCCRLNSAIPEKTRSAPKRADPD